MLDMIIKRISRTIFSTVNTVNKQILNGVIMLNHRVDNLENKLKVNEERLAQFHDNSEMRTMELRHDIDMFRHELHHEDMMLRDLVNDNRTNIGSLSERMNMLIPVEIEDGEKYVDDTVQEVAREVGIGIPEELNKIFPNETTQEGIIFTNGIITTNGAVVPEGMSVGDSTETLAKAAVNPEPKTIEIQDSIDKTL